MQRLYRFILIDHIDTTRLIVSHLFIVGPHGRPDDNVIKAVPIEITGGHGIAEVSPNLVACHIMEILQR